MPQSNSTFEGTFADEDSVSGSSEEDTSSGEEESSVEESDNEDVPMSKSGLPFDQKVEMFEQNGSARDQESFSDEDSESGSEYSSEEERSESEGSHDEKDGRESFLNEQERLRGMGGIPSNGRFRRWYVIGLAIFCVILLGLAVGLGVGLSRKKRSGDEEKSNDSPGSAPAVPGTAPANPPVRMPVKLPNPPKVDEIPVKEFKVEAVADEGTTIYRSGDPVDGTDGTVLVQGGDPSNDDLGNAYALFELPLDIDAIQYAYDKRNATFCLEHVPNNEDPERVVTYSACLISDGTSTEPENLVIADDCAGSYFFQFDVSPGDTTICMDVTDMLYIEYLPELSLSPYRRRRVLEDATPAKKVVMMIDNLDASDEPGDSFVTDKTTLTVTGEKIPECNTIVDLLCSSSKFSLLCDSVRSAGLDVMLGDNRVTFTVFAPTNDAFLSRPSGLGLTQNGILLYNVLMTHTVFEAQIQSSFIDCSLDVIPPIRMASGVNAAVKCDSGSIFVSGDGNTADRLPKVVDPDLKTCNGIVHGIDYLIIPAEAVTELESSEEDDTDGDAECLSFAEAICSDEELGAICALYNLFKSNDIMGPLFESAATNPTTLFLPRNEAAMGLDSLYTTDTQPIADLLLNHAVADIVTAEDLECGGELEMAGGGKTKTTCDGDEKFQVGEFNDDPGPKIIVADILYCSGVIHVVDQVILVEDLQIG